MSRYKIKKASNKRPIPLPEALPERGNATWEIKEAVAGRSSCRFTEDEGGVLTVPLIDKECETCGENHAAAARLHELAHAALSPDIKRVRNSFTVAGEEYRVTHEAIVIAEEMRADYQAAQVAEARGIPYELDCTYDVEYMVELIKNGDLRELIVEMFSRSSGLTLAEVAITRVGIQANRLYSNHDYRGSEMLNAKINMANRIKKKIREIKLAASDQYSNNLKSWTGQLKIAFAIEQMLNSADDFNRMLELTLDEVNKSYMSDDERAELYANTKDGDIQAVLDDLPVESRIEQSEAFKFIKNFSKGSLDDAFAKLQKHGKKSIERVEEYRGKPVWGPMSIEEPKLTRTLPIYKRGWKPKATAEGAVPLYMHRLPIDGAVFKTKRQERGGSVLIDVSGSMDLSREEVEAIVEAAPASVIAIYSGNGESGILRVIARDGKWLDFDKFAYDYHDGIYPLDYIKKRKDFKWHMVGMDGENTIDKPALEWLAQQPLPRIWVSDGQVIDSYKGLNTFCVATWKDCEKVMIANQINRVETPEEARKALEGKMALWR